MIHPRNDAFRHPADDQVVVVGIKQTVVKDFFDRLIFSDAFIISKERRIGRFEKFIEAERVKVEQIDHAYRIGFRLGKQCPKQTSGRHNMVIIRPLFEVFERIQRLRAFLYLIEDQ